jgi:diguanylate cyclase (GGDEF)-like protein
MHSPVVRKSVIRTAVAALLLLCGVTAFAGERGYPLITVYPPEVHKGGPQTFDVAQDSRGVLYFGNLAGLLTYDGAWWRLIKLPDDQAASALAADANGQVVVGAVDELGYVARDSGGQAQYRSLLPLLPAAVRDFGDVRAACSTSEGFLFLADHRLLLWDGQTMRISPVHDRLTSPRRCRATKSGVYLTGPNGLQTVDLRTFKLTDAGETRRVDLAIDRGDGSLVISVRNAGLFSVTNGVAAPIAPAASEWLKNKLVTGGARIGDGRLVITTRQHGLILVAPDGAIDQIIDDAAGLPDAIITEAITDREGALWLAMEGPLARIDVATPVSLFDGRRGIKGSVGDVIRHDGRLYAASSHGLFAIDESGMAHHIDGFAGAAWTLHSAGRDLLVGTSRGLYLVRDHGTPQLVQPEDRELYDLTGSASDPQRVWLATREGIASVRRNGEAWEAGPVIGGREHLTSVLEHGGSLFSGSVFDGIVRVDGPHSKTPRVRQFGTSEMNVFAIGGRVVFVQAATGDILSESGGKLIPDPLLGHIKGNFFLLLEDTQGNVWVNSTPPQLFKRGANGRYATEGLPLVSVTATDIQCLRATADGVVWFGSDKGLFRYEPSAAPPVVAQPPPLLRRVVAADGSLIGGIDGDAVSLPYSLRRRMRIEFAPASYRPGVLYQYRLEPTDAQWSAWTSEPFVDHTNLDAGDYVFHVRSRGAGMAPSAEARWKFSVRGPWYRTAWAYALWAIAAGIVITLIIAVRTRALRDQAERLRARVSEQTIELREKNELLEQANARLENLSMLDDLTGIANRRYFQQALSDEWNRAVRREEPLSLVLVDLDYFKELNDRRGHRVGDECLRDVGRFLGETIRRSGEVVARYGGEEFAVLLPGVDGEEAVRVAERLRAGIEKLDIRYEENVRRCVTTSCGVATMFPRIGDVMETLVDLADRALYAAKHAGRNRVSVSSEEASESWMSLS